jgi:cysteine desulfurase / selenocysteine lyase
MVGVAALWAGQDWLDHQGVGNIRAHETRLAERLAEGMRSIDGVRLYCCDSLRDRLPTISMNVEGLEAGDVGTILDVDHDVATRTGLHCAPLVHQQLGTVDIHGAVRFSIGPFNTEEHVDAAVRGVEAIARWHGGRKLVPVGQTVLAR